MFLRPFRTESFTFGTTLAGWFRGALPSADANPLSRVRAARNAERKGATMMRTYSGVIAVGFFGIAMFGATAAEAPRAIEGAASLATNGGDGEGMLTQAGLLEPGRPQGDTAEASVPVGTPTVTAKPTGLCRANQVEVEGDYCPWLDQKCLRWLDPDLKLRCAEFAPESKCQSKTIHKHFCIDTYEFPNKLGEKPKVLGTWYEARDACKAEGKRLCRDSEWTLACEGQERLPYPYGYARNAEACNIDKPHPAVDEAALGNPHTRQAEADRLWQGVPSGSMESCVSPYGVHDMTGNVDEWVINESGKPYQSGSKGGYWGPVRTRCRPMTVAHYENFSFYQLGFRCCSDVANDGKGDAKQPAKVASVPSTKAI
jgi:hypothetical protein